MLSRFSGYPAVFVVSILIGLFLAAASPSAYAAAFDCGKAKLAAEVAICRDDKLSRLDEQMADQYFKVRTLLTGPEQRQLSIGQRAFISARNNCESETNCIAGIYSIRMDELCKLGQIKGHPCSVLFTTMTSEDHPQLNYCHMDSCGWFVIREAKRLGKNKEGELLELTMIDGNSSHYQNDIGVDEYPSKFDESVPIYWADKPSISYAFCSKILPVVMYQAEGRIEVAPLDFGGQGIFGYNSSAAGLYVYACEHLDPGSFAADGFGAKYGFRPLPENLNIEISNVNEILDIAKEVSEGTYKKAGKSH